mgnify:CR=1 FL=1
MLETTQLISLRDIKIICKKKRLNKGAFFYLILKLFF